MNADFRIDKLVMREISLSLVEPFLTSRGEERERRLVIVEAHAEGLVGYGEAAPLSSPVYTEETLESIWHVVSAFLFPLARANPEPAAFAREARAFRRNTMAKAAVEGALWDLAAKRRHTSLASMLGGVRRRVESGIAVGIQGRVDELLERIGRALAQGYRRIKIKIKPGWDEEPVAAIRRAFGTVPLMADANSAYTVHDIDRLKRLDRFGLLMIEQPFDPDNLIDHALLQRSIATPICLDETLVSYESTRQALELGCCRIVNLKIGRVGGLSEALKIHALCRERGVPLWCGGLLESGIGRGHNLALASLPGFELPGDLSASSRYFARDVVEPEITLSEGGWIEVPAAPGIGLAVRLPLLESTTIRRIIFPCGE